METPALTHSHVDVTKVTCYGQIEFFHIGFSTLYDFIRTYWFRSPWGSLRTKRISVRSAVVKYSLDFRENRLYVLYYVILYNYTHNDQKLSMLWTIIALQKKIIRQSIWFHSFFFTKIFLHNATGGKIRILLFLKTVKIQTPLKTLNIFFHGLENRTSFIERGWRNLGFVEFLFKVQ